MGFGHSSSLQLSLSLSRKTQSSVPFPYQKLQQIVICNQTVQLKNVCSAILFHLKDMKNQSKYNRIKKRHRYKTKKVNPHSFPKHCGMFISVKTLYCYGQFFTWKVVSSPAAKYMSVTWKAVSNVFLFFYFLLQRGWFAFSCGLLDTSSSKLNISTKEKNETDIQDYTPFCKNWPDEVIVYYCM